MLKFNKINAIMQWLFYKVRQFHQLHQQSEDMDIVRLSKDSLTTIVLLLTITSAIY